MVKKTKGQRVLQKTVQKTKDLLLRHRVWEVEFSVANKNNISIENKQYIMILFEMLYIYIS